MKGKEMKKYHINFEKLRTFWRNPNVPVTTKAVFMDLLLYAGQDNKSFPSQSTIASDLVLSTRYIRTHLALLKKLGWVSWEKGGYGKSNRYSFNEEIYFQIDRSIGNQDSSGSGIPAPIQTGSIVPTKVVMQSNQINSSQYEELLTLFENTRKRSCTQKEIIRFRDLIDKYSFANVKSAIKDAGNGNYPRIEVGLIEAKLEDIIKFNSPKKEKLIACNKNGCEDGLIFNSKTQSYRNCSCRDEYLKKNHDN